MTHSPGPVTASLPFVRLLGVRIDCLRLDGLLQAVAQAVHARHAITVMYVNVHCMNLAYCDARYAAVLEDADIVYCDGTGVRLGARLAGLNVPMRMTGADWIVDLCRSAVAQHLSLFLLGGAPGTAEAAAHSLRARHPGLDIRGTSPGYGTSNVTIERLNGARPDIVLVGMGSPKQEQWIAAHREEIDAPVLWAVGALFDFVSGKLPRGPSWMTEHGLEWLCRLAVEPRKLWRRYLIGNPRFIARVLTAYRLGH